MRTLGHSADVGRVGSLGRSMWLPDETLYSLLSRMHRCSDPRLAQLGVLGASRRSASRAHDLPGAVDQAAAIWRLGTAESVIRRHTVLPFYLPLRDPADEAEAIRRMRGPGIGGLKARLGMLASGLRAHHPLKACPACMREDQTRHDVAYWHLQHQFPGVWRCQAHQCRLLESTLKSTGVERFGWSLPEAVSLRPRVRETREHLANLRELLDLFGRACVGMAQLSAGELSDPQRLVAAHRRQLGLRAMVGATGRVRHGEVAASLLPFLSPLRCVPELDRLALNERDVDRQVACLTDPTRARPHPLRFIALTLWLYGSWDDFLSAYQSSARPVCHPAAPPAALKLADPRERVVQHLILDLDVCVTRAAAWARVDPKTAQHWASRVGIASRRRASKLCGGKYGRLVDDLRTGMDKRDAARRQGVAIGTITHVLLREPGLHEEWQRSRLEARRERVRSQWQRIADQRPSFSATELRRCLPAEFAWLYRNDRAWLNDSLAHAPSACGNHRHVDWNRRDRELAATLDRECARLLLDGAGQPLTKGLLCQRVPALKAKIGKLDRLPLCRAVIDRLMRRTTR